MTNFFHMKPQPCPKCGKILDRAGSLEESEPPDPDSLTVCLGCEAVLRFDKEMVLRQMTQKEIEDLPTEDLEVVAQILRSVRRMRGRR